MEKTKLFLVAADSYQEVREEPHTYAPSFGITIMDPRRLVLVHTQEDLPLEKPLRPVKPDLLDSIYGDYEARIRKRLIEMFCLPTPSVADAFNVKNLRLLVTRLKGLETTNEGTLTAQTESMRLLCELVNKNNHPTEA